MKLRCILFLAVVLASALSGCTQTTVYAPNGKRALRTSADATNISYAGQGWAFHADKLDHSTPALARGKAVGDRMTAAGAAIAASGLISLF
jgi:hypothetical protein